MSITKKKSITNKKKTKSSNKSKSKKSKKIVLSDDILSSKEMTQFRSSKSISLASRISGIKDTLVSDLLEYEPVSEVMHNLCNKKLEKVRYINPSNGKRHRINKDMSKNVCNCLLEKNKELSISELENKVNMKLETPSSECIKILDDYYFTKL